MAPGRDDLEAVEAAPLDGRANRAARRRPGVVPSNLRQRIHGQTLDFRARMTAEFFAQSLDGLAPSALTESEREKLRETWGREEADAALELLDRLGYGAPLPRKARSDRRHGIRREEQLRGVLGKLPRSIALRLPTSAATHKHGRTDGVDRWGPVKCSMTLRADHIGLLAAMGGLWHSRSPGDVSYVDATAGWYASMVWDCQHIAGKDVVLIHQRLAELEQLELCADVEDKPGKAPRHTDAQRHALGLAGPPELSGPSEAHRIPSSPVTRVLRRVGDRWVPAGEYAAALAAASEEDLAERYAAEEGACPGQATIRVYLADWFREELAHSKRRPVFIQFDVWRHLRPSSRRLYAYVQGLGRDGFDDRIDFYLAPPTLFTLGLTGKRLDRAGDMISADLTALWHADQRYHQGKGFRRYKRAGTNIPEFQMDPAKQASAPTEKARHGARTPPKRPRALRGALGRQRRFSIRAARQLEEHEATRWMAAAQREAEQVRQVVERSLGGAGHGAGPARPNFAAAVHRRQGRDSGDDAPAGG